jgi:hypothetical protein
MEDQSFVQEYIDSLSEKEKKAYEIAKEHLGMSFQIEKSNGFRKWLKNRETTLQENLGSPS